MLSVCQSRLSQAFKGIENIFYAPPSIYFIIFADIVPMEGGKSSESPIATLKSEFAKFKTKFSSVG